jgi:hypothetical protein
MATLSLLRARMAHRAVIADIGTLAKLRRYGSRHAARASISNYRRHRPMSRAAEASKHTAMGSPPSNRSRTAVTISRSAASSLVIAMCAPSGCMPSSYLLIQPACGALLILGCISLRVVRMDDTSSA